MMGIDIPCGCCGDAFDSLEQYSDREICEVCFFLELLEQDDREGSVKQL